MNIGTLLVLLLAAPASALACEQRAVLPEHLQVDDAAHFYVVAIRRAHGANLVATVQRSFGGAWSPGQTVTIQFEQQGLPDAVCELEARGGETWLLNLRPVGGALRVSPFDSRNVPHNHERFATWVRDIEAAVSP
ncbi:MAG TPA: hypothetical protein VGE56_00265 [Rhodocyclaceae bacterium]